MNEENIPKPLWPVDDEKAWRKQVIQDRKDSDARIAKLEVERKKISQGRILQAEKRRDQEADRQRTIKEARAGRLETYRKNLKRIQGTGGANMENEKKESKTGLVDDILKANLGSKDEASGSYEKGAVAAIVATVLDKFPNEDPKSLKGLVFSRRAVIKKALEKAAIEAEATPETETADA